MLIIIGISVTALKHSGRVCNCETYNWEENCFSWMREKDAVDLNQDPFENISTMGSYPS
jgi:hypothetical protein